MLIREDLDKTYLVEKIANIIKDKKPVVEIYKKMDHVRQKENHKSDIVFIEDVYELYLSLGVPQDVALEHANKQVYPCHKDSILPLYKGNNKVETFISILTTMTFISRSHPDISYLYV